MLWSVTLQAVGDRALTHEEIVELADAVAGAQGRRAPGIGTEAYGAQLVVEADDRAPRSKLGQPAVHRGRRRRGAAAVADQRRRRRSSELEDELRHGLP